MAAPHFNPLVIQGDFPAEEDRLVDGESDFRGQAEERSGCHFDDRDRFCSAENLWQAKDIDVGRLM